jgi:phosphoribosylanthranilate isomerase
MRVRVKICGITCRADADAAVRAGCDALGFMFHPPSTRYVSVEQARSIIATLPPFVTTVGIFVDVDPREVRAAAHASGVALAQFHGDESDAACAAAGLPYIKAIRMTQRDSANDLERRYPNTSGFLLDAGTVTRPGGTGDTFDWSWWPSASTKPLILAGGLTASNVVEAIRRTRPFAVDVSTGVEGALKGAKDATKIEQFMTEVRRANERN